MPTESGRLTSLTPRLGEAHNRDRDTYPTADRSNTTVTTDSDLQINEGPVRRGHTQPMGKEGPCVQCPHSGRPDNPENASPRPPTPTKSPRDLAVVHHQNTIHPDGRRRAGASRRSNAICNSLTLELLLAVILNYSTWVPSFTVRPKIVPLPYYCSINLSICFRFFRFNSEISGILLAPGARGGLSR